MKRNEPPDSRGPADPDSTASSDPASSSAEFCRLAEQHARRYLLRFEDSFTRAQCDDLVQDSTMAAWRWAGTVREPARLGAFVRTIARRTRCRALRAHYRRREQEHDLTRTHDETDEPSDMVIGRRAVPLDWLVPRLMRALGRLRPVDRGILAATLEGFCCAEIADRYQLTEENVKVRLHRVRQRVRTEIEHAVRAAASLGEV